MGLFGLSLFTASQGKKEISIRKLHRWLQDFLYRAPITIWIFLLSGGLALALGLLTMSF